jgi:hypothetical protein
MYLREDKLMSCRECQSERIVSIMGHCVDRFTAEMGNKEYGPDYVPKGLNIGQGDDIQFEYCLDCGMIQDDFPINPEIFDDSKDDEE